MRRQEPPAVGGRVIRPAAWTPPEQASQERIPSSRQEARRYGWDWVAWACLALGIVCGAGALYFAILAVAHP